MDAPTRNERLPLYLTPEHKALLARLAAADGETMAAWLRALIRAEARRRGLAATADEGRATRS